MNLLIYPKNFWIICFSLLFFMISFNIIMPELNDFITVLGGGNLKGLIIALFTITAAISRPFSGKLSDTIGRKKVMLMGMAVAVLMTLLYPMAGLGMFLTIRLLHGFSTGFLPTGATALITDILPAEKRGIGMGIWGTFISAGIGAGQVFSSAITTAWGLNTLFLIAAIFGVLSGIMIGLLKETLPNPQKFRWEFLKIKRNDIIEPSVIPAAVVMFSSAISTGIVFVITPEMSAFFDIPNKGIFFGYYVLSTILIRLLASRLSDRIGRRKTLIIGLFFMVISMSILALTRSETQFIIGAIVFGISTGISSPTLFAWTADLSHPERRGVGAGTLFIALEVGIMIGSFGTLATYDNTLESMPTVFFVGASFAISAILYLLWHLKFRESKT